MSATTTNSNSRNSRNSNIIRDRIKEILQANIFKIGSMTSQIGRHNNCRTIMSKSQRHSKIYLIRKKTFHRKYKYYETVTITTDRRFFRKANCVLGVCAVLCYMYVRLINPFSSCSSVYTKSKTAKATTTKLFFVCSVAHICIQSLSFVVSVFLSFSSISFF